MTEAYFILEDGEQKGPFTFDEVTDMGLEIHTRVLSPFANTWQDACDLPEFYPYFEALGIYFPTGDNLASFWWRLLAYVIDILVLYFVTGFIFGLLASLGITFKVQALSNDDLLKAYQDLIKGYTDLSKPPFKELLTMQLISGITFILYNSICEASPMRGSLGKKLCKLVVVDVEGVRLSYLNALVRSIGKEISILFLNLGFLSIFFTEHKQALHDFLAKTYVVKRD